eukprot:4118893-Pyramimonas_sp.AAC.1
MRPEVSEVLLDVPGLAFQRMRVSLRRLASPRTAPSMRNAQDLLLIHLAAQDGPDELSGSSVTNRGTQRREGAPP